MTAKKKPARKAKTTKKGKHPGGRPTDYKPEYARMAHLCIEDSGFSMYKLAKLFNVDRVTIYRWLEKHKEFRNGVEKGRTTWDGHKIHTSLVKRSVGFSYTETTQEAKPIIMKNTDTGEETVFGDRLLITKKVRKYFPPDVAAIKHWQVNRDPEKWRDRTSHEIGGKDGGPIEVQSSAEDKKLLQKIAKELFKKAADG